MTRMRPFRRRLGRLTKFVSLAAALSLFAVPLALAGTETGGEHTPEGVPPGYSGEENPGSENMPEGVPPEVTPPEGVPPEGIPPEGAPVGPPAEAPPAGVPVGSEGNAPPEGVTTGPPAGVSHGAPEGVASSNSLSAGQARALGREQCQEWKTNFGDNRSQFGKCIADVAKALHGSAAPGRACGDMSRKPDENEHRSDFSACVAAAAQALREGHDS
jgi:hypothetical protein